MYDVTDKVLDFILNRSRRALNAELKNHIDQKITEQDCSHGIVYLLHAMFSKVLNDRQLDAMFGPESRKVLKKLIKVKNSH